MWEVVKTVKGYDVVRMKGSRGCYHVTIKEGNRVKETVYFKTIKSAVQFINDVL